MTRRSFNADYFRRGQGEGGGRGGGGRVLDTCHDPAVAAVTGHVAGMRDT